MALRDILIWPDPILAKICDPVDDVTLETRALVNDMYETLYAAQGRGLAAPQVGETVRVFIMDATWKDGEKSPVTFVNPELISASETLVENEESCLSIPDTSSWIKRPDQVRLRWKDMNGVIHERDFDGFEAICVQHELDHLNGTVTLDHVNEAIGDDIRRLLSE
jgi:peptide deformylase